MIGEYLCGFARRCCAGVPALRSASAWDGAWDPAASAARMALATPALLVGMLGFEIEAEDLLDLSDLGVDGAGRTGRHQLTSRGEHILLAAADARRRGGQPPPEPAPPDLGLQPQLRLAATIVTAGGTLESRAQEGLDLLPPVIRLAAADAWHGLRAESLTSPELRDKGVSAVVLAGWRQMAILPALADPRDTSGLDVRAEGL